MAHQTDFLSQHLAQNLSTLRKKRGLSQHQLAVAAKVPRSTITYMESGQGNPSLQNLAKVAQGLQITIEELLSRPLSGCQLTLARQISPLKKGGGLVEVFKLMPDSIPGTEIDRIEIQAGGRLAGIPHVANTKEYLMGIQGTMQVNVATEKFKVAAGDVLSFAGDQPHSYHNPGATKAICLSVVIVALI